MEIHSGTDGGDRRETLAATAQALAEHADSHHRLRAEIARVPPDELTRSDLLTLRSGYMKAVAVDERIARKLSKLLDKIADAL